MLARDNVFRTILDSHESEGITKNEKEMEQRDKRDHVLEPVEPVEPITRACAYGIPKQKRRYVTFPSKQKEKKKDPTRSISKKERVGLVGSDCDSNFVAYVPFVLVKAPLNFARGRRFAFALETAAIVEARCKSN